METIEYTTTDKSEWGDGPWQDEPDKRQWTDPATGLPCLIVRGPMGSLCGYVGVAKGHPWFEVPYGNVEPDPDVHGGLTFSDSCDEGPENATVCHIPGPGEPDNVWWLGFDTGHFMDRSPGQEADMIRIGLNPGYTDYINGQKHYRTMEYVTQEVQRLAEFASLQRPLGWFGRLRRRQR